MTPVTALVTVFILSGLTATGAQTRMEQFLPGFSYFVSNTLHSRSETSALCARWSMHDIVQSGQIGHLLFRCQTGQSLLPSFRARYWVIQPNSTATHASAMNFITCDWSQNVPVDNLMLRVMCLISTQVEYNGTVPAPEEPPPGSTTPSTAGPQTELPPSCGSILFQIPMKTQFLYMILVLVIPLLNAYSQTIDASESLSIASAAANRVSICQNDFEIVLQLLPIKPKLNF